MICLCIDFQCLASILIVFLFPNYGVQILRTLIATFVLFAGMKVPTKPVLCRMFTFGKLLHMFHALS